MSRLPLGVVSALGVVTLFGQEQKPSQAKPEFYDEPTFIVAGVADPAQRGGHGSDPALRSAEALAKATISLRNGSAATATERELREALAREPNRADLHHSVAALEEKLGNPLDAVREYQRAASLEGSETNLFDWGAELLAHRADDQAIEVFAKGNRLFPKSTRILLGLAVAWYSRGSYDQAAQPLFDAADLNPNDPAPYMFLGKVSSGTITESPGFAVRLERFANLHPDNAWANYYYATVLWKGWKGPEDVATAAKVGSLLENAIRLDPHFGAAFLQLGIVFSEENDVARAIASFQSAIESDPGMEEAHYRLGQAYRKAGETAKAQKEIQMYQQLAKESAQQLERERAQTQQFVFSLRSQESGKSQ